MTNQNSEDELAAAFAALRLFFRATPCENNGHDGTLKSSPWRAMALLEGVGECDETDLWPPAHPWQYAAASAAGSPRKSG